MEGPEGCEWENLHVWRTTKLEGFEQDFWMPGAFCEGSVTQEPEPTTDFNGTALSNIQRILIQKQIDNNVILLRIK